LHLEAPRWTRRIPRNASKGTDGMMEGKILRREIGIKAI